MRRLGIGEVCRLLDIKPHILRYWEAEIPLLDPAKNTGGRRVYGDRELNILYRLKYLVQEKRFTVEGAKLALMDELAGGRGNEKAIVIALRKHLLDAHDALTGLREKTRRFTDKSLFPPGQGHLRKLWGNLSEGRRRNLIADLMELPSGLIKLTASLAGRAAGLPPARRIPVFRRDGGGGPEAAEAALAAGRIGVVTLMPEEAGIDEVRGQLERLAGVIREASFRYGTVPVWYIFAGFSETPRLEALFAGRGFFFLDRRRIVFIREPLFPYLDADDRLLIREDGGVASYPSGSAGALLVLGGGGLERSLSENRIDTLYFLPLNRFAPRFPDLRLLSGHFERGADASVSVFSGAAGPATTGIYVARRGLFSARGESFPARIEERREKALIPGARSAEEIGEFPVRKITSCPYYIAAEADRVWALLEDP